MSASKTPIFVDVLNYCEFFIVDEKSTWDATLGGIARRVKKLCLAAEAGGYALNIFIDDGYATPEAQSKWRSRKMDECQSSAKRRVPVGWTQLLGELFALAGVPVHYSICDNDDTIAAYAIRSSSRIVVSRDSDFFRYRPRLLRIISRFYIDSGVLVLSHSPRKKKKKETSWRDIIDPPPATNASAAYLEFGPEQAHFLRGPATSHPGLIPSPHLQLRQLRAALYARLGVDQVLEEVATCRQRLNPAWDVYLNRADPELDQLLDAPLQQVHSRFFDELADAHVDHMFATRLIVAEILDQAQRLRTRSSLLDQLKPTLSASTQEAIAALGEPLV